MRRLEATAAPVGRGIKSYQIYTYLYTKCFLGAIRIVIIPIYRWQIYQPMPNAVGARGVSDDEAVETWFEGGHISILVAIHPEMFINLEWLSWGQFAYLIRKINRQG